MNRPDDLRIRLTFWIALAGMLIIFSVLLLAVLVFQNADNPASTIVAVVGSVTGVIGTLAGYVAGQQAGSAGKEQAEARADRSQQDAVEAQRRLGTIAGAAGEDAVAQARRIFPEWFAAPEAAPPSSAPEQPQPPQGGEHG
jgi:hypothetical protein